MKKNPYNSINHFTTSNRSLSNLNVCPILKLTTVPDSNASNSYGVGSLPPDPCAVLAVTGTVIDRTPRTPVPHRREYLGMANADTYACARCVNDFIRTTRPCRRSSGDSEMVMLFGSVNFPPRASTSRSHASSFQPVRATSTATSWLRLSTAGSTTLGGCCSSLRLLWVSP